MASDEQERALTIACAIRDGADQHRSGASDRFSRRSRLASRPCPAAGRTIGSPNRNAMWRRRNRDAAVVVALCADRPTRRTEALMSAPAALAHAIDLERYPIDDLDGPAARTLVGRCREQLRSLGACELEGFLRADAVTDAVRSVHDLRSLAFRTETTQPRVQRPRGRPRRR
jgi:hypothetical protein